MGSQDRALIEAPEFEEEPSIAPVPLVLSATPSASELLFALKRRWFAAFGGGLLLAALVAAGVWFLMPESFTARTLLHVAANRPFNFDFARDVGEGPGFDNYQKTQLALVKSRWVLNAALRDEKSGAADTKIVKEEPDAIHWLEKNLQVDFTVAPEIMRISLGGNNEQDLITLVNAVTNAYVEEVVNKEDNDRRKRLDMRRSLYIKLERDLEDKQKVLKEMSGTAISPDPQTLHEHQRHYVGHVERARSEYLEATFKIGALKTQQEVLELKKERQDEQTLPDTLIDRHVEQDFAVLQIKKDIAAAEVQIEKDKKTLTPGSKLSARLLERDQHTLDELQKRLAAKIAEIRPKVIEILREKEGGQTELKIALLGDELLMMEKQKQSLEKILDALEQGGGKIKNAAFNVGWLQGRVNRAESFAKQVGDEIQKLELELDAPARVRRLDDAIAAPLYDKKRRMLIAGGGAAGALALVVALIVWLESRRRRINTVHELVQGLGIRVVGTLPKLHQKPRAWIGRSQSEAYTQNLLAESVDAARTVLLHSARTEGTRVVMVTSAVSGEGKTSLAGHLATSLARAGRRTLLVDADLRKPGLHSVFDMPCEPGLSNLLLSQVGIDAVIQQTNVPDLWLVPAGGWDAGVAKALASEDTVNALIKQFRQDFDFVIIDTCPVLAVVDPLLVGLHVDGVILSVLRDVSRLPTIFACRERLDALGIRLLGAVVSGTSTEVYAAKYQLTSRAEV